MALQTRRSSRVQLPTCCEILLDFGVALTQSLRPIAYIAAMDERRVTVRDRVLKPGTIEFGSGANYRSGPGCGQPPSILPWLPMDLTGPVRSFGANESGSA
jgi:hypothetical protein